MISRGGALSRRGLFLVFLLAIASLPPILLAVPRARAHSDGYDFPCPLTVGRRTMVAVVEPTFTTTPYAGNSFYQFYRTYRNATGVVRTDLNLLSTKVVEGWGTDDGLIAFLSSGSAKKCGLVLGQNLRVVNDTEVSAGALFTQSGGRRFDAVIIGHEEYVTRQEYQQFWKYVASGGRLVEIGANSFFGLVSYERSTQMETYVAGHGWIFNGTAAWKSRYSPFIKDNAKWFGSSYCCTETGNAGILAMNYSNPLARLLDSNFGSRVFWYYTTAIERNFVQNMTGTSIIATLYKGSLANTEAPDGEGVLAAYAHQYRKGVVVCLCALSEAYTGIPNNGYYASDTYIGSDVPTQFFLVEAVATPNLFSDFVPLTGGAVAPVGYPTVGSTWALTAWRSHYVQNLTVIVVAVATNPMGQTVAVGESEVGRISPDQTAAFKVEWDHPLDLRSYRALTFFVVTADGSPVSVPVVVHGRIR